MNDKNSMPPLGIPIVTTKLSYDSSLYTGKKIITAKDAVYAAGNYISDMAGEAAYVIVSDADFRVLCIANIGKGSQLRTEVSIRDAVRTALLCNGLYLTLIHNHPEAESGGPFSAPKPSAEDIDTVNRAVIACAACGLFLWDSIIVQRPLNGEWQYYSFRSHNSFRRKYVPENGDHIKDFLPRITDEEKIPWQNITEEMRAGYEKEPEEEKTDMDDRDA